MTTEYEYSANGRVAENIMAEIKKKNSIAGALSGNGADTRTLTEPGLAGIWGPAKGDRRLVYRLHFFSSFPASRCTEISRLVLPNNA